MAVLYVMCQSANVHETEGITCRKMKFFIGFSTVPAFLPVCVALVKLLQETEETLLFTWVSNAQQQVLNYFCCN